jgi:hypothetical protein
MTKATTAPFRGYASPNYTPVPDQLFDEQLPDLSGAELKVLLYIMRRTFGFKKDRDTISLSQMLHGIVTRDGRVLDRGTGLSKDSAVRALRSLATKGIILRVRRRSAARGDEPTSYSLHLAPVSDNRPPPGGIIGHAPPRKSDTQDTVRQETVQHSNSRMGTPQDQPGGTPARPARPTTPPRAPQAGPEAIGTVLRRRPVPPTRAAREVREVVSACLREVAAEFNDHASLAASTSRALNLMAAAGITDLGTFTGRLYEARAITKERTGAIRSLTGATNGGGAPLKNKMAYFFSVLADVLGLRAEAD